VISRLVFIETLPAKTQASLAATTNNPSIAPVEYYGKALDLCKTLEHHRYSKTVKCVSHKALTDFFIFLEANSLRYSKELALAWVQHMGGYTVQWRSF
jgi:hypothetical protein